MIFSLVVFWAVLASLAAWDYRRRYRRLAEYDAQWKVVTTTQEDGTVRVKLRKPIPPHQRLLAKKHSVKFTTVPIGEPVNVGDDDFEEALAKLKGKAQGKASALTIEQEDNYT